MSSPSSSTEYLCCDNCDQIVSVPPLMTKQQALCPRCHSTLKSTTRWSLTRCAWLAGAMLMMVPFAFFSPLLSIDLLGTKVEASLWDGIWKMATQDYPYTAFLVFLCALFLPLCFAGLIIALWWAKKLSLKPRTLLLSLSYIKPWVMLDVYLISLGVTLFKVREYAELHLETYLIAFILTALFSVLLFIYLQPKALWSAFYPEFPPLIQLHPDRQYHHCDHCHYYFPLDQHTHCPRCEQRIRIYDKASLQPVWAMLVAGMIMLVPANVLPISVIYLNGVATEDTLWSGVMSFIEMENYFIAFVVFFASIFVPISKVLIMLYLLICLHFKLKHAIRWQMRLLHIVHFIGRWSMLDLFVLALMMSLITRGQIIDLSIGPAALYFGIAVFFTMIASTLFDSRLLWKIYDAT